MWKIHIFCIFERIKTVNRLSKPNTFKLKKGFKKDIRRFRKVAN